MIFTSKHYNNISCACQAIHKPFPRCEPYFYKKRKARKSCSPFMTKRRKNKADFCTGTKARRAHILFNTWKGCGGMDIDTMLDSLNTYVRSELMILVPVLYFVIKMFNKSKVKKERIPLYLCLISIGLSGIYTFSTVCTLTLHAVLLSVFSSVTQGLLLAGCALFGAVMMQAHSDKKCACENKTDTDMAEAGGVSTGGAPAGGGESSEKTEPETKTNQKEEPAPEGVDETQQEKQ